MAVFSRGLVIVLIFMVLLGALLEGCETFQETRQGPPNPSAQ
jgi:hypothetical protein